MIPRLFTHLLWLASWHFLARIGGVAGCLLFGLGLQVLPAVAVHAGVPDADAEKVLSQRIQGLQGARNWRDLSAWVRSNGDNSGKPFAIIDKKAASVHIFGAAGDWRASSPVLLGLALGDESVPGIGERKMAEIKPHERTTPAGRFVSEPGVNLQGEDIVWIDYEAAVSMHRVRTGNGADRRLQRLATPTVADNRISYGCVNVPVAFYNRFIKPVFGALPAVVYVLPDAHPLSALPGFTEGRPGL